MSVYTSAASLIAAMVLTACAPMITSTEASLTPVADRSQAEVLRLGSATDIRLPTGYTRVLPAASRWGRVGQLPQGTVYRSLDSVLTIEGRQVHEAYLVVAGDRLNGFYLPGEARFAPLSVTRRL